MGVETTLLDPRKADDEEATTTVAAPVGIRSLSLTVIAIVAAVFALQYGKQFFIPLVISVLVSYALDPVVSWCAKRGVPRSLAAAVVLLSLVGSVGDFPNIRLILPEGLRPSDSPTRFRLRAKRFGETSP